MFSLRPDWLGFFVHNVRKKHSKSYKEEISPRVCKQKTKQIVPTKTNNLIPKLQQKVVKRHQNPSKRKITRNYLTISCLSYFIKKFGEISWFPSVKIPVTESSWNPWNDKKPWLILPPAATNFQNFQFYFIGLIRCTGEHLFLILSIFVT